MNTFENYKYFYREFVKYYYKDFYLLLFFVLLEAVVISLSVLSIIPIADFFLDQDLTNANIITKKLVLFADRLGFDANIYFFLIFFILINFLKSITSTIISFGVIRIKYKVIERFSFGLLDKLLSTKWSFFLKNSSGKIINTYTNEIKKTAGAINDLVTQIALGAKFITYIITPFIINFKISFMTIVIISIFSIPFLLVGKYANKLGKKNTETGNTFQGGIVETLQAVKLIISYARKKISLEKNIFNFKNHYKYTIKFQVLETLIINLYHPFAITAICVAILYNFDSSQDISALAAVLWSLLAALPNLNSFLRGNASIQNLVPSFQQFRNLEIEAEKSKENFGKIKLDKINKDINFENVSFKYYKGENVLENCNLSIKKNKITALVGESGSGKSTIVDLLLGLQEPDSGKISIDGENLKNLDIMTFREKTSVISQDTFLFNTSIYENLLWANSNATPEQIDEVLKLSNSYEFIQNFEKGVDTLVGERGIKLSGGQRQRISIARGLLKNPSFIVLDEPTSSLDSISEKLIQESLKKIATKTTTLIIAHRFSTIKQADYIYIINKGKIIQEGSFETLKNQQGEFKKLFNDQII